MITIRHASASGRFDEMWCFDAKTKRIEASVRIGARLQHLSFVVCAQSRPVFGTHPIVRRDGESWIVLPVRFERTWPDRVEVLHPRPCPVGDLLSPGEFLALSNTPDAVSAALELL
jgi:hypothetical protein